MEKIPNTKFTHLRKQLNLSQVELAKHLSVSQGTITDIERGRIKVSKRVAKKLQDVFNVNSGVINEINNVSNVVLNQVNNSGVIQGFSNKKNSHKVYGGEKQAILDVYRLVEKLYTEGMESNEIKKLIHTEVEKLEDKTLSYYLRTNDEIKQERKDLSEVNKIINDVTAYADDLKKIVDVYFNSIKNIDIHYHDYQSFKENRIKILEGLLPYQKAITPLVKSLTKFFEDFKQFDTKNLIDGRT